MMAVVEAARIRARPGGPDDKQLMADGGPGADGAAQRVAVEKARIRVSDGGGKYSRYIGPGILASNQHKRILLPPPDP
jgi:hypothetical protein